jgi:hypothetical protein
MNALADVASGNDEALWELSKGQKHNPHAQEIYSIGYKTFGSDQFWRMLIAAPNNPSDFGAAKFNLDWQWANNASSISDAAQSWAKNDYFGAVFLVLLGQRHNTGVMNLYRACITADSAQFFKIVQSYVAP